MHGAAVTLGLSSLALATFPLVRPFFPFDPTHPVETLAGASRAVTSVPWLIAHYLALLGFVLLLSVLPALHTRLARAGVGTRAGWAMLLSGVGVALILPTLGVELYALPAIGRLYGDGKTEIAPAVGLIYLGGATLVMLVGLVLLAIGAITFATAVARSRALPTWAAVTLAAGLAGWCPFFPPPVRIVDGLLIGIGGLGIAWDLWHANDKRPVAGARAGSGIGAR